MAKYELEITEPRPYFAELPYYVWGQVNYDSDGDCTCPIDRQWRESVVAQLQIMPDLDLE